MLEDRLRDKNPVEWVAMKERQLGDECRSIGADRQLGKPGVNGGSGYLLGDYREIGAT
jgi:hypothetical protein